MMEYPKLLKITKEIMCGKTKPRLRKFGLYLCKCGNEFEARVENVSVKKTISCGCARKGMNKKHGMRNTSIYNVWRNMKDRCFNKNDISFKNYGGRGISVCKEWKDSFENFYEWVKTTNYNENLDIDRKDNDGNYEPSNCRFVTRTQNNRNKRNIILNEEKVAEIREMIASKQYYNTEIAKKYGVCKTLITEIKKERLWKL